MAGEGDRRSPVAPFEGERSGGLTARKLALVRVVVGIPMFVLALFGLLVAYRLSGRPLRGGVFWSFLFAILAGMTLYSLRPLLALLRRK